MTEYEVADLMATYSSNGMESLAIFISIFTAYMVIAYTVGHRLSKFQTAFVTISCLLFAVMTTWGASTSLEQVFFYADQLSTIREDEYFSNEAARNIGRSFFYSIRFLLVMGALVFMWQVRRTKTD